MITDVMGKAPLAAGIDQHGRGARAEGVVGDQRRSVDAFSGQPAADHVGPGIASYEAGSRHGATEAGQAHTCVADDAAGHDLNRVDVKQAAAADRLVEPHGPHEDVGDAGAADQAVDVTSHGGRFSHCKGRALVACVGGRSALASGQSYPLRCSLHGCNEDGLIGDAATGTATTRLRPAAFA
jgi:hypothetical protein